MFRLLPLTLGALGKVAWMETRHAEWSTLVETMLFLLPQVALDQYHLHLWCNLILATIAT
jgi:hypothetical protein